MFLVAEFRVGVQVAVELLQAGPGGVQTGQHRFDVPHTGMLSANGASMAMGSQMLRQAAQTGRTDRPHRPAAQTGRTDRPHRPAAQGGRSFSGPPRRGP
ncbi:hypothetical protein GCM10020001_011980 [Nonomuraea salmonea]